MSASSLRRLVLVLALSSSIRSLLAADEAADPRPTQAPSSFLPKQLNKESAAQKGCSYTVKIKTSCSSPRYTRDRVSLAFGDAYKNEVYAPRLDNPQSHVFEQCSTDTFKIQGPCGYGTCYLYLRRDGRDGWTPDWVKIYEPYGSRVITFDYGTPLPNGVWYGFNQCARAPSMTRIDGDGDLISVK